MFEAIANLINKYALTVCFIYRKFLHQILCNNP